LIIDIHTHSSHTTGCNLSISQLADQIKKTGLDGFCITDTNSLAGIDEAASVAKAANTLILVGLEAQTDCGYFLVFVPEPKKIPDLSQWLGLEDETPIEYSNLVKAVKSENGIIIAACPFDRNIPNSPRDSIVRLEGIGAVEVLCGTQSLQANELAEELAAGSGLPGVGGSNTRQDTDEIGKIATLVRGNIKSEADLIEKINSFDVWPVSIGKPQISIAAKRPRNNKPYHDQKNRSRRPRSRRPRKK
jgi:hypothetical protein